MATISGTSRPGYVWDSTDNVWYPIGTGVHTHDYIPNTIADAKGDLVTASANDTPARLAVGNNGETLVADSSTATGLRYQANFAAGKNKILNSDYSIWQRGTSFTPTSGSFSADRFYSVFDGTGSTRNISRQTFTPGTAPVAGYEGTYFLRYATTVAGTGGNYSTVSQNIEDVRTFAGQTATFSFWAKAASNITLPAVYAIQRFGSGGSSEVVTPIGTNVAITTSWQRFTYTFTVPSISGKTIGTNSYLDMEFYTPLNSTYTLDTWGWQLEAGSVATAFQTATGTIQGELAACQRYFTRIGGDTAYNFLANGYFDSTTTGFAMVNYSSMRTNPAATFTTASNYAALNVGTAVTACTAISADFYNTKSFRLNFTVGSARTAGQGLIMTSNNTTNGYIDISAEL